MLYFNTQAILVFALKGRKHDSAVYVCGSSPYNVTKLLEVEAVSTKNDFSLGEPQSSDCTHTAHHRSTVVFTSQNVNNPQWIIIITILSLFMIIHTYLTHNSSTIKHISMKREFWGAFHKNV